MRGNLRKQHLPQVRFLEDMLAMKCEHPMELVVTSGCTSVLLAAGPPCQPFSGLGVQPGWDDPRAAPLQHTLQIIVELRRRCKRAGLTFNFLLEEVASMQPDIRDYISQFLSVPPCLLQSADWGWVHRSRLWWGIVPPSSTTSAAASTTLPTLPFPGCSLSWPPLAPFLPEAAPSPKGPSSSISTGESSPGWRRLGASPAAAAAAAASATAAAAASARRCWWSSSSAYPDWLHCGVWREC